MPQSNALNTSKGREFQLLAARCLSDHLHTKFITEHAISIGSPPKPHHFDLASIDNKYIGECKNFSWTEGNNIPSAKMTTINEAVFYLQHVPSDKIRFVILRRDINNKRRESIAEYYYRINKHLLSGIKILELNPDDESIKELI